MAAAAAETMVADVGGVAPEGSLLMDEPLLEKADESTTHAVGSGSFTNWLAENEKSAMYALARLPALHIVFWVVTILFILNIIIYPNDDRLRVGLPLVHVG